MLQRFDKVSSFETAKWTWPIGCEEEISERLKSEATICGFLSRSIEKPGIWSYRKQTSVSEDLFVCIIRGWFR